MYFMKGSLTMEEAYQTTEDQRKLMVKVIQEINKKKNKGK
jgi:hypothetical protein